MSPENIDRVFGRSRLKMMTGEHVEVFREEALPGERRRYTKRFLSSMGADFRHWTEREWRILARLVGHGIGPVPDVVQFDRGADGRAALVQTYDAGVTVDHWATLLPVERDGRVWRHVFDDCAHWWALARHCLVALDAIHELQLVHLDLKADNVCIPCGPSDFDPARTDQSLYPVFGEIALIDFAFSLVSGEPLKTALPIGHQADYPYQSPRLLHALEEGRRGNLLPTRQLDWRCDVFSLAAMLRRYLPSSRQLGVGGWTNVRLAAALSLVRQLDDAHDRSMPAQRPHQELIELASRTLRERDLAASLARGWRLAREATVSAHETRTPVTRIALPVGAMVAEDEGPLMAHRPVSRERRAGRRAWLPAALAAAAIGAPLLYAAWPTGHRAGQPVQAQLVPTQTPSISPMSISTPPANAASAATPTIAAASTPMPLSTETPAAAPQVAAAAKPLIAVPAPTLVRAPAAVTARRPGPAPRPAARAIAHAKAKPQAPAPHPFAAAPAPLARAVGLTPAPPFAPAAGPARGHARIVMPPLVTAQASSPAPAAAPEMTFPPAGAIATPVSDKPSPMAPPPVAPADPPAAAIQLPDDFASRANVLMTAHLPELAQRAERRVLPALHAAARADGPWQNAEVVEAARAVRLASAEGLPPVFAASADARALNDAAEAAFWHGHNPQQALGLQMRAFGADPHDLVLAGNLAFYYLKQRPARAEAARQLALYTLTMPDARYPDGRIEDWTNFAIASALTGRERDARNALFVTLALSQTVDRQCRIALAAVASHGDRLRAPTEAMLARIRSWGRSQESSFCRWPPSWSAGLRG